MKEKEVYIQMTIKNHEVELLRKIIEAQENEREKIAKDIHDDLGPKLTIIKLHLTSFKKSTQQVNVVENTIKEIDDVISDFRSISSELSPTHVIKYGLTKSISHFLNQISETSQIKCVFQNTIENDELFDKLFAINIYRLYNELTNNLLKHALPKTILVETHIENEELTLTIRHDGYGLLNNDFNLLTMSSKGQGISSINSRVLLLNANINFTKVNNLYEIKLSIPLNA